MTVKSRKFSKGIRLKPTTMSATLEGEIRADSANLRFKAYIAGAERTLVTEDQTQTLTNKDIDADNNTVSNIETDNLKAGVLNTDLSGAATDTELPSALAVKTALEGQNEASEVEFDPSTSTLSDTNVQDAIDSLDGKAVNNNSVISGHISSGTAHSAASIFNTPSGNLTATDQQAANNELQSDIDTRALADNGTLTNASIETPTRLDVKQDTEANLITYALTATNGQLCFATDTKEMYQVVDTVLKPVGGGGASFEINQASHSLSVGDGIFHNGTLFVKAQADAETTLAYQVVIEVSDSDNFIAADIGRVEVPTHGFTVGEYYFLSDATPGLPVTTEPSTGFSNPLFYVEDANILHIKCLRPTTIGAGISIDDLSDVSAAAPTDGQALVYVDANSRYEAQDVATQVELDAQAALLTAHEAETATHGVTEIVGTSEAQDLSNKTITDALIMEEQAVTPSNPSAGDKKVYPKTDGKMYTLDSAGNEVEIGSGSGASGINYIENSDFEEDATGWSNTGAISIAAVTSDLLRGEKNLGITKTSDVSGSTISYDLFTIDKADLAKKLTISFDYDFSNGYADGDIRVQIVKDPNGTAEVIRVNGEDIKAGKGTHYAQFQTDATEQEYRLELYWVDSGTGIVSLNIDNVIVGPTNLAFGQLTKIQNGKLSGASFLSTVRRFSTNAETGDVGLLTYSDDGTNATRLTANLDNITISVTYQEEPAGSSNNNVSFISVNGTKVSTSAMNATPAKLEFQNTLHVELNQGDYISFEVNETTRFETSGNTFVSYTATRSSNTQMSEDLGGRDVVVTGAGNSGAVISANTERIDFTTVIDTTASWSNVSGNGTDTFTAPETGSYIISGCIYATAPVASVSVYIYVNGARNVQGARSDAQATIPFTGTVYLTKGDLVDIRTADTFTLNNATAEHWIHIQKLASPQTILETETVAARYTSNSGQSIPHNSGTVVVFEDIDYDTHNAYNPSTGVYTIPASGIYSVSGCLRMGGVADVTGYTLIQIAVNGSTSTRHYEYNNSNTPDFVALDINDKLSLEKGDEVDINVFQASGNTGTVVADPLDNIFSIARIK